MKRIPTDALRLLLILVLVFATGCEATGDVEEVLAASDAALILRETDVPVLAPDGAEGEKWAEAVQEKRTAAIEKIDGFIARYKDRTGLGSTINTLRLRKALLYLAGGQKNLARASFGRFDPALAGNARDLGLYRSYEALVWWAGAAEATTSPEVFSQSAERFVPELDAAIDGVPRGSGIRYYLATTRAHVHLKWASTESDRRTRLKSGLSTYSGEFDAAAREYVRIWMSGDDAALRLLPEENLRWYAHAEITFDLYQETYRAFLEEIWRDHEDDDPDTEPAPAFLRAIADGTLERTPVWPEDCRWFTIP